MYLICVSCHHHAEIKPLKKDARLRCKECGSRVARTTRVVKSNMLNGGVTEPGAARVLTYAGLLSIAEQRGYKPGWAAMKWKIIFGDWPPDDRPPVQNPSQELMWWIRQQNIAYAKANFPREKKPPKPPEKKSELMSSADWETDL
jgi:DNA-directed RNA polymerase subunit RPC12/RpoP